MNKSRCNDLKILKTGGELVLTIFIRTIIIYVVLLITMRLMGKRQLGELDVGELVITILLSEIASLPITNPERKIFDAILPIAILVFLEYLTSTLILKFPFAKKILSSKPAVVIAHGKIDRKAMKRIRISVEELLSQIRQNGIYALEEVDYAILEENGKMSIIPKSRYRQVDRLDMNIPDDNSGIMHILISDGVINEHGLHILSKDRKWLDAQVSTQRIDINDIFCMTCDDADRLYIIMKDGSEKKASAAKEAADADH